MIDSVEFWKLGELTTKLGSGITPRGGKKVYTANGIPFIRSQNVYNDHFTYEGLTFLPNDKLKGLDNVILQKNDNLINITGDSVARTTIVPNDLVNGRVNQHVMIIRPNEKLLNYRYLHYFLISPITQKTLLSFADSGGTRKALTKEMISELEIPLPPLPTQERIADILGTLDDKIELNRQMNHTLEAMARAIFKSWFVDFDPVYAKMEGRDYLLPVEVLDLFPAELVESELGLIPKGWEVKPLDKIAKYMNGYAMQKYPPKEGEDSLPVIKIRELRAGATDSNSNQASLDIPKKYIITDGDVLFSWSGSLLVTLWAGGKGALNQHLFKVTSTKYPKWFYYLWTDYHLSEFQRIAAGKATTMGHIKRSHLNQALTAVPNNDVMTEVNKMLEPIIDKTVTNSLESRTFNQLRDTLLPKLILGEIGV